MRIQRLEGCTPSSNCCTCVAKVEGQVATLQHCADDAFRLVCQPALARCCIAAGCRLQCRPSELDSMSGSCHMQFREKRQRMQCVLRAC